MCIISCCSISKLTFFFSAYDGKAKVWSVERRECVATQTESDKTLWAVKWLPKTAMTRNETFVTVGANRSISFYREASGG
jgi:superkiller protein 8